MSIYRKYAKYHSNMKLKKKKKKHNCDQLKHKIRLEKFHSPQLNLRRIVLN